MVINIFRLRLKYFIIGLFVVFFLVGILRQVFGCEPAVFSASGSYVTSWQQSWNNLYDTAHNPIGLVPVACWGGKALNAGSYTCYGSEEKQITMMIDYYAGTWDDSPAWCCFIPWDGRPIYFGDLCLLVNADGTTSFLDSLCTAGCFDENGSLMSTGTSFTVVASGYVTMGSATKKLWPWVKTTYCPTYPGSCDADCMCVESWHDKTCGWDLVLNQSDPTHQLSLNPCGCLCRQQNDWNTCLMADDGGNYTVPCTNKCPHDARWNDSLGACVDQITGILCDPNTCHEMDSAGNYNCNAPQCGLTCPSDWTQTPGKCECVGPVVDKLRVSKGVHSVGSNIHQHGVRKVGSGGYEKRL